MPDQLACYTLFDITQTNVPNRSKPKEDVELESWLYMRNTQCNFDTIIQAISLRSLPENISTPVKTSVNLKDTNFGSKLKQNKNSTTCWKFTFEVQDITVFSNSSDTLGELYKDCDHVPMIKCGTESSELNSFLETDLSSRNIYFVKY